MSHKLKIYKDGSRYVTGGIVSIEPSIKPEEEFDLSKLEKKEIRKLKKNPKDKKLMRKIRKENHG